MTSDTVRRRRVRDDVSPGWRRTIGWARQQLQKQSYVDRLRARAIKLAAGGGGGGIGRGGGRGRGAERGNTTFA